MNRYVSVCIKDKILNRDYYIKFGRYDNLGNLKTGHGLNSGEYRGDLYYKDRLIKWDDTIGSLLMKTQETYEGLPLCFAIHLKGR